MAIKHDEIVVWLYSACLKVDYFKMFRVLAGWSPKEKTLMEKYGFVPKIPFRKATIIDRSLEAIVETRAGLIVGYVDVLVTLEFERFYEWSDTTYGPGQLEMGKDRLKCAFEVKPTISDLGETLRQIQKYKKYYPEWHYCVCSPDVRYQDIFTSQGITFLFADMGSPELPFTTEKEEAPRERDLFDDPNATYGCETELTDNNNEGEDAPF